MRKFKKTLSMLLAATMAFSAFSALTVTASAAEVDSSNLVNAEFGDYEYQVFDDDTAQIMVYRGTDTNVTIPSEVDGYTVTSIRQLAFMGSKIQSLVIPDSITEIGPGAFFRCSRLKYITIPDSVTYIGEDAFSNTLWLSEQDDGLVYAGKVAYTYKGEMTENTSILINNGTIGVAECAFDGCENLTSISIPDSVNTIAYSAFRNCTNINNVLLPDSITQIHSNTFSGCTSLSEINIPDSVTYIDSRAFQGCTSLSEITIPNSVTYIGEYALGYIYKSSSQLGEYFEKISDNFTIKGVKGSAAEQYANENGFKFVEISDVTVGDVNGDGALSVADATIIQKCIASITELTPEQLVLADFNGDGAVNVNDATAIQRALVK